MLRFFREEKGFAKNAVFFQFIQQILLSLFIAAVYRGLTVQDQTNFFIELEYSMIVSLF